MTERNPVEPGQHQRPFGHDRTGEAAPEGTVLDQEDPKRVVHLNVEHVHGPEEVAYAMDELVVLCLVRNGRPYVRSFVEHYSSMGVKHMVFLDNGSTDGTVEALKDHDNVTVLRTGLSFKTYQMPMKQYLIERFGRGRWSLYVDIDELFDYPYSDVVGLGSLLRYLSEGSYTAVVGQMLDMFAEEPLSDAASDEDEPLKELHRFYDISNIRTLDYWQYRPVCGTGNVLTNEEITVHKNGIQNTVFGATPPLTKHPLVFLDDKIKPMDRSSHSASDAHVADFTCVLFHYKFLNHLYGLVREAVRQENYMRDSKKHKKWYEVLEKTPSLLVKRETAREIRSVNELVENGFLVVSEEYMSRVDIEEEKRVARAVEGEPRRFAEAFFKARAEAQSLKALRLARQVEGLKRSLAEERRKTRRPESNAQSLEKTNRRLEQTNRNLENQIKGIKASRSWRLVNKLAHARARVLNSVKLPKIW